MHKSRIFEQLLCSSSGEVREKKVEEGRPELRGGKGGGEEE